MKRKEKKKKRKEKKRKERKKEMLGDGGSRQEKNPTGYRRLLLTRLTEGKKSKFALLHIQFFFVFPLQVS